MACESAGVGVKPQARSAITSTSFPASTSSAVANAGSESACVSLARNSGPSTMPRGAETHLLGSHGYIRVLRVVGCHQPGDIDEHGSLGRFACKRMKCHRLQLTRLAPLRAIMLA